MLLKYCPVCRMPASYSSSLCPACGRLAERDRIDSFMFRCPDCFAPLVSPLYKCNSCDTKLYGIYDYKGPFVRRLVEQWKFEGKRELSPLIARLMMKELISLGLDSYTLVPVPSTSKRRGWDQMKDVSNYLRKRGFHVANILERNKTFLIQQKTLSRKGRIEAAAKRYRLKPKSILPSASVIVIDDVITTGSTIKACINLLKERGITVWGGFSLLQEL